MIVSNGIYHLLLVDSDFFLPLLLSKNVPTRH
jgi:hypothetical protein